MRAIKIDPDQCSVRLIEVEPDGVAGALGSDLTDTVDFEDQHCLVIDDGEPTKDHPPRFRFANGPLERPIFGSALILGVMDGNWAPATMGPKGVKARIIWEEWDGQKQRYAVPSIGQN